MRLLDLLIFRLGRNIRRLNFFLLIILIFNLILLLRLLIEIILLIKLISLYFMWIIRILMIFISSFFSFLFFYRHYTESFLFDSLFRFIDISILNNFIQKQYHLLNVKLRPILIYFLFFH